jgi:hypothetical protein
VNGVEGHIEEEHEYEVEEEEQLEGEGEKEEPFSILTLSFLCAGPLFYSNSWVCF